MNTHAKHPSSVCCIAARSCAILAVTSAAYLTAWALGPLPDSRITLAGYLTLTFLAACAGAVYVVAGVQVATHNAFRAGFVTGASSGVDPLEAQVLNRREDGRDPLLHLVE